MLTEEQREAIQQCIDYLTPAAKEFSDLGMIGMGDSRHARCIRALRAPLAAHSAGAQGEPVGELVIGECKNGYSAPWLFRLFDGVQAKDGMQMYAHPQPMTDAARDSERFSFLIINIKRYQLRESKGHWYYAPIASQDWQSGYASAREAIDAEIERIEREGEV